MAEAKKATRRVLDFTNVKDKGNFNPKHVPAGDYRAKIVSVEETESSKGNEMWIFGIQLTSMVSAVYPERIVLNENSLWKLRNLLAACGMNVPKKKVAVDPNKVVGKEIGISLEDDEYEGKMKSVISGVFSAEELTDDEPTDEDDDDADEVGDSDETTADDDDLEEMEVDEL